MKELEKALGSKPPKGLAKLDAADRADLAAKVAAARKSQDRALLGALNASLKIVPRPLRGPLRKVLGA
jgi:hypothetical protein